MGLFLAATPVRLSIADRVLGNSVGAIESVPLRRALRELWSPVAGQRSVAALPYGNAHTRPPSKEGSLASAAVQDSYLVDSASSHMLVSKIKPCMSKYKQLYRETANGSLNQLSFI